MKIGLLTSGGDTPGMNAVINGAILQGKRAGHQFIGYKAGWKGLLENDYIGHKELFNIVKDDTFLFQGGTVLKSSRTNPFKRDNGIKIIKENLKQENVDALIAIGGDDTLGVAYKLHQAGINIVGVPKTIDNDLSATDYTFGFNTAYDYAGDAIRKLHTTARSHKRVFIVEIMGRHSGWITLYAAIAGRAHLALIPEFPLSFEKIKEVVERCYSEGSEYCLIAVAEGYELPKVVDEDVETDEFGHKLLKQLKIGDSLAKKIEEDTGHTTRAVVLGHVQRAGFPSAYDRVLAYRLGVKAAKLIEEENFGYMSSLDGDHIIKVSLADAVTTLKTVDKEHWESAKPLFGL